MLLIHRLLLHIRKQFVLNTLLKHVLCPEYRTDIRYEQRHSTCLASNKGPQGGTTFNILNIPNHYPTVPLLRTVFYL